ncbi:POU domain, class 4, transcription factor 1-like [Lathamus discolor]|uniref:POU domain, class 4, transcription factor 1-like n=1 Tax=Lathamus discolor TaxID=678569 RepID=UPI0032B744C4
MSGSDVRCALAGAWLAVRARRVTHFPRVLRLVAALEGRGPFGLEVPAPSPAAAGPAGGGGAVGGAGPGGLPGAGAGAAAGPGAARVVPEGACGPLWAPYRALWAPVGTL